MTFPTIPTAAAGRIVATLNTAGGATKTFPDLSTLTKNAGDLLIAVAVTYDGNSTNAEFSSWGGGFTEFGDQATTATMGIGAAYKWSTGSETGTFTVTTADTSTNDSVLILVSIPGAHPSTPPVMSTIVNGTTAAADPAALDPPGWATEDTLWIAVAGSGEVSTTGSFTGITAAPTNYTDLWVSGITADVVGGVDAALAFRQLAAASVNDGPFTVDTTNARNSVVTIAVRPAPAATPGQGTASLTLGATGSGVPRTFGTAAASLTGTFTSRGLEPHPVRSFNGAGDIVRVGVGNCVGMTYGTFAALAKCDDTAAWRTLIAALTSAGGYIITPMQVSSTDVLTWDGVSDVALPQGTWVLAVVRKATGTATPRYSLYNFSTGTWTHANAASTRANFTALPSDGTFASGTDNNGGEGWDGLIGAWAAWKDEVHWSADSTGDAAIEAAGLHTALVNWLNETPDGLWSFDQAAVTTSVTDLVGSGDQVARTGTSVVTTDPPFGFDWTVTVPPVSGQGTASLTLGATASGVPETFGQGSAALALGATATGLRRVFGWRPRTAIFDPNFGGTVSTPDKASFQLGTELSIRLHFSMIDWTPSSSQHQFGQASGASGNWSWMWSQHPNGTTRVAVWPDGLTSSLIGPESPVLGYADGSDHWLGCRVELNIGSNQRRWTYEQSTDGETWTALGSPIVETGATSFFNSTAVMGSPGLFGAGMIHLYSVRVWSDAARTQLIVDLDATRRTPGETSWTDSVGNVWTLGTWASVVKLPHLTLTGTASGTISTPAVTGTGQAALSLTAAASGTPKTFGTGAAPIAVGATALGVPRTSGSAAATFTLAAAAIGVPRTSGAGAASLSLTATASGAAGANGLGTATLTLLATAAGVDRALGTGAAALSVAATATGGRRAVGSGSSTLTLTATGSGVTGTPPVTGQGSSNLALGAVALGVPRTRGTAATSLTLGTTASGVPRTPGVGTATVALVASALGAAGNTGLGLAALSFQAAALGSVKHTGSGQASPLLLASALGSSRRSGTALVALTLAATGSGTVSGPGVVYLQLTLGELARQFEVAVLARRYTAGDPSRRFAVKDLRR